MKLDFEILDPGGAPPLEYVPVDMIETDHQYQREAIPSRIRKILRDFDWRYFQPVTLTYHPDRGKYTVLDGQHRVEAIRLHPYIQRVPAAIIRAETLQQEADAFVKINTERSKVNTIDRYHAGLTAEDPNALMVKRVLDKANCAVVESQGQVKPRLTNAVTSVIRSCSSFGEDATSQACLAIADAWPQDGKALKGTLIRGIARVFYGNPECDIERIKRILREQDIGSLATLAEAMRKITGGSADMAISKTIVETYNRGKRINLLVLDPLKRSSPTNEVLS
ncbi:DUF6551 family protein [uncultured Cohaesibacter sp.]|uniref:DUF6551 family protein n=1 Tax=uncultured Cohaesibacter sp. TaxID=1002546 RepID=UPI0029C671E3|nr:DUF6551 family protein [uncultured Cohaesibacter sp.]